MWLRWFRYQVISCYGVTERMIQKKCGELCCRGNLWTASSSKAALRRGWMWLRLRIKIFILVLFSGGSGVYIDKDALRRNRQWGWLTISVLNARLIALVRQTWEGFLWFFLDRNLIQKRKQYTRKYKSRKVLKELFIHSWRMRHFFELGNHSDYKSRGWEGKLIR